VLTWPGLALAIISGLLYGLYNLRLGRDAKVDGRCESSSYANVQGDVHYPGFMRITDAEAAVRKDLQHLEATEPARTAATQRQRGSLEHTRQPNGSKSQGDMGRNCTSPNN
jgi:hypothetical protein